MSKSQRFFIFLFFLVNAALPAQTVVDSPFNMTGPPDAFVYTNLKSAIKEASNVYKLDLTNQILEPKLLAKSVKLTQLQALKLADNHISQWPDPFLNFSGLVFLSSYGNAFTDFPVGMDTMQSLRFLELGGTKFDTLPLCITHLGRLKSLKIQDNADTMRLTKDVGYMTGLTDLVIYKSPLDSLPVEISEWKKLKTFYMASCNLKALPATIGNLLQLESLYLDNNHLCSIPRDVAKLKNLYTLSLRNNCISQLPDQICFLKNLAVLDLRGNPISDYDVACLKVLLPGCTIYHDEPTTNGGH